MGSLSNYKIFDWTSTDHPLNIFPDNEFKLGIGYKLNLLSLTETVPKPKT